MTRFSLEKDIEAINKKFPIDDDDNYEERQKSYREFYKNLPSNEHSAPPAFTYRNRNHLVRTMLSDRRSREAASLGISVYRLDDYHNKQYAIENARRLNYLLNLAKEKGVELNDHYVDNILRFEVQSNGARGGLSWDEYEKEFKSFLNRTVDGEKSHNEFLKKQEESKVKAEQDLLSKEQKFDNEREEIIKLIKNLEDVSPTSKEIEVYKKILKFLTVDEDILDNSFEHPFTKSKFSVIIHSEDDVLVENYKLITTIIGEDLLEDINASALLMSKMILTAKKRLGKKAVVKVCKLYFDMQNKFAHHSPNDVLVVFGKELD